MAYTTKQNSNEQESAIKQTTKPSTQLFTDQRDSTNLQLKQQQLMQSAQSPAQLEQKSNNTGLPDNLKSGIENMSGYSMDDVKVHYNSDKPQQLNAHAYAQGSDIHVAPGQEQHVPHEAWHVVQQKQGRVQPAMQMKAGVPVNDDAGLEHEADVMGAKALSESTQAVAIQQKEIDSSSTTAQLTRGNRARALVGQGLQDMAEEEAGAADAYDEDYDEEEDDADGGEEEYEDGHEEEDVAGEAEEEEAPAPAGYPITVNGRALILTAGDISGGTVEPVPGRTNGDVQLRMNVGGRVITLHVHPTAGSGGTPTGGGSSLNGRVGAVPGNVPQNIVDLIAAHPNYATVVASCAPVSRADGAWR